MRDHAADAATGQDAERVEAGRHEVAIELWGRADQGPDVCGERLRAAEERPDAGLSQARDPRERRAEEWLQPLPVRGQLAEGEVPPHSVQRPGRAHWLEQADQHAVAL